MKVGLIGSVGSSYITLQKLIEHNLKVVGVWGYEPDTVKNVSGYTSMRILAETNKIVYYPFVKINDLQTKQELKSANIDLLFVVGLSQLIDDDIIEMPKYGCVGFHPTLLPKGRGRAPMAWMILKEKQGAANFFRIEKTADSGNIYIQEPFDISDDDDASSIGEKLMSCIAKALDKWLPEVKKGSLDGFKQDETKATYYARRAPLDGFIDWHRSAKDIDRLIKASTNPHPGAYTFYEDSKIIIWKSHYHSTGFPVGVIGRIVDFYGENPIVQTGDGFIEIQNFSICDFYDVKKEKKLIVGSRLGYYEQYEIFKLRNEIKELRAIIEKIKI